MTGAATAAPVFLLLAPNDDIDRPYTRALLRKRTSGGEGRRPGNQFPPDAMAWSFVDQLLSAADEALRTLAGVATAARPAPGRDESGGSQPRKSAALMRVNHTGEICAQALYSGQALFANATKVRAALRNAAAEERDHLAWCGIRLDELDSRPSYLAPAWYAGSFIVGVASGLAGDRWSMGFLAETESQVERHLESHLEKLPVDDHRSRAMVAQMCDDERDHGTVGRSLGAAELPYAVKLAMRAASKVMTRTSYWV